MVLVALSACTGVLDGTAGPKGGGGDQPPWQTPDGGQGNLGGSLDCELAPPEYRQMPRLGRDEFVRTVRDLLGVEGYDLNDLPADSADPSNWKFSNTLALLTDREIDGLANVADFIGSNATRDLPALFGCTPANVAGDPCVRSFLGAFLPRAFRRPATEGEIASFSEFYETVRADFGVNEASQVLVASVILSPEFLYLEETDAAGDEVSPSVAVSPYAMANRLSYFLVGSMPDAELFAAAESGALRTVDGVRAQADRLIDAHPEGSASARRFFGEWLETDRLARVGTPSLRASLEESLLRDTAALVGEADYADLHRATEFSVNAELAALLGAPAPSGENWHRVVLPGDRLGVATHPTVLASHASPSVDGRLVHRGVFVYKRVFAESLQVPELTDEQTSLDSAQREQRKECWACHKRIDPTGNTLGAFDDLGRFAPDGEGAANGNVGLLSGTDVDGKVSGHRELSERLAGSELAAAKFAEGWLRFAQTRAPDEGDDCSLALIKKGARDSGGNIREILLTVVTSDSFRFRQPENIRK